MRSVRTGTIGRPLKWRDVTILATGAGWAAGFGFEVTMDATPTAATARREEPAVADMPIRVTVARIIIPTITELERPDWCPDLRMMPNSLAWPEPEARSLHGDAPPSGGTMPTMHRVEADDNPVLGNRRFPMLSGPAQTNPPPCSRTSSVEDVHSPPWMLPSSSCSP